MTHVFSEEERRRETSYAGRLVMRTYVSIETEPVKYWGHTAGRQQKRKLEPEHLREQSRL